MSNFDLNIENYSQAELEEIFDLKQGYQMNQLLENESKLIESITKDKDVTEKVKKETLKFIHSYNLELADLFNIFEIKNGLDFLINFDYKNKEIYEKLSK